MDQETEDAFKALGALVTEGFKNTATKQDIKELENKLRTIVREEVQDIREAIEERCKPTQIG